MSAFRRKGRKFYEIEPDIPGIGRIGRRSTSQTDKQLAEDMEAALRTLAMTGWSDLVEQLRDGQVTLAELWMAKLKGERALEELRLRKDDPWLDDAVEAYRPAVKDERVLSGLDQLKALAPVVEQEKDRKRKPPRLRVSWLFQSSNISLLYAKALETREPNSVRRSLHRACAELITHRKNDRGAMLHIMANAKVPSAKDERKIWLSTDEIQGALDAADEEFRRFLGFALTTGVDRGPQLAMKAYDLDEQAGSIGVPDTKTGERPRRLVIDGDALMWALRAKAGKKPGDSLFGLTKHQVRNRWEAVAKAIGREDVRWKDLRGVFATYWLLAGGSPRELQELLGHATMAMTLRYIKRLPIEQRTKISEAAKRMGLGRMNLKVIEGGKK